MKTTKSLSRLITISLLILATTLTAQMRFIDQPAEDYTDEALVNAGATYAAARVLNAGISSLQSIELSVGVASFSPGQMLDPLNDLIERFSWITMMALASLGVQKLGLVIIGSGMFNGILAALAVLALLTLWVKRFSVYSARAVALFALVALFRFSLAFMAVANAAVESYFLQEIKQEASQGIERAASTQKANSELQSDSNASQQSQSLMESVQSAWESATSSVDGPTDKIDRAIENINQAMANILDMIALFILQTILLPLLFLYLLKRAGGAGLGYLMRASKASEAETPKTKALETKASETAINQG
ncbi:hypothetical protein [Paraferrimonas sedimenticola]|uniref:TrbL/VirB6 plasmid conjugal transfer protein n=1 Tax=Paraferrimonas sedimenticola TaxID=375674 RepID=A0AA37RWH5_9GAMM|nr:hypothetical protein [Paraferrimonas sedimenticola]GLP96995.1 hypothetical protein GCM10007895_23010 [Paraferrimonas sedimenticola]